jgi:hypothetical protein
MGLWPTDGDESPFLRFIDSKQVTRDFRRSVIDSMTMSAPVGLFSTVEKSPLDSPIRRNGIVNHLRSFYETPAPQHS